MRDAWVRGAGILAGLFLLACILACGGGATTELANDGDQREQKSEAVRELDAIVASQKAVRKFLKYPNDASFAWGADSRPLEGDDLLLSSTVKAKNPLGAELTYEWSTIVQFVDGEAEVAQVMIDDEVVYTSERLASMLASAKEPEPDIEEPTPKRHIPEKTEPELRTWTDDTGEHQVEARFVSAAMGKVKLRKEDGTETTLPIERLSEADQEWIRNRARK